MPALLFVDCNHGKNKTSQARDAVSHAVRQHVMLDHITKRDIRTGLTKRVLQSTPSIDSTSSTSPSSDSSSTGSQASIPPALSRKSRKRVSLRRRKLTAAAVQCASSPQTALIRPQDQRVYNSAWWHLQQEASINPTRDWKQTCKSTWNQALWEVAKLDETMLCIFQCFSAAKEAHTRSWTHSDAFYVHRGEALTMVAKDLMREGQNLRIPAVVAMCLLCKISFIEQQFEAAESHNRAIAAIAAKRLAELPGFLFQFLSWADLRLTGVHSRAPMLPYCRHFEFTEPVDEEISKKAKLLSVCNVLSLPPTESFLDGRAEELLNLLHKLASVYDTGDTPGNIAWAISYDTAYLCATLQPRVHTTGTMEEKLFLLASQVNFWGTCRTFVPQAGIQRHLFDVFSSDIRSMSPESVQERWLGSRGSCDALLWIFYNVIIGSMHASSKPPPGWLRRHLQGAMDRLRLHDVDSFKQCLRGFPYCEEWAGQWVESIFAWTLTGDMPAEAVEELSVAMFKGMRLTFDVDPEDEKTR